ncbi:MAG: hypothetical protein ACU0AX_02625 [Roseovarius sp.]|uniref:hypothetical protein n=1 Tax=Roseovarius sp. TaxID=1486281 RepID=UPI00405A323E
MNEPARHLSEPDAPESVAQAVSDVVAMAESALAHGGPKARRAAARVLAWVEDGDCDLEKSLGLSAPGRAGARQILRNRTRNSKIRHLAAAHYPEASLKKLGADIADDWRRYETGAWPRHNAADAPPATEPAATFFDLLRRGHGSLSSEAIRKILAREDW